MTRRAFFAASAAVVLHKDSFAVLERADLVAPTDPLQAAQDESYWAKVREAFVQEDFLFLNHGGICPTFSSVMKSIETGMVTANRAPSYHVYRKQEKQLETVRKRLAMLFGCDAEEIAIMPNATTGLQTVILGYSAEPGDRIVTTTQDYPRVLTGLAQRERREGIRTVKAKVPAVPTSEGDLIDPIAKALVEQPRLVVFPRIGYLNGTVFPSKEIVRRCQKTMTLIDGAHGIGLLPENAKELGCDAYACCLHKWLLGPLGSGFLFVKKERIKDVWPLYPADADLDKDIRKFEQFGTRPTAILLAIEQALDCHEAIGTERKAARLEFLRFYWTSRLADQPKIHFRCSLDPRLSAALTTLEIEGLAGSRLADWLFRKHRIFVTSVDHSDVKGVRVSPNVFTSLSELDRLVNALREAVTKGIG